MLLAENDKNISLNFFRARQSKQSYAQPNPAANKAAHKQVRLTPKSSVANHSCTLSLDNKNLDQVSKYRSLGQSYIRNHKLKELT